MKVVVLGGAGFIGSHLVDRLLAEGTHVVCVTRHPPGLLSELALRHSRLQLRAADIAESAALIESMQDADVIVHLVSTTLPASSNLDPRFDVATNLIGALNILEAARAANVQRVVFASSGGTVYGVPQKVPLSEEHPTEPTSSYGITKLAIEKYLALYRHLHGIDSIILRISNPYGERQRLESVQGAVSVFIGKALRGEPIEIWGDGSVVRDFIHVSDVASAVLAAINYQGSQKVFNIGSGEGVSLNDLVRMIGDAMGREPGVIYKPARGFDVPRNVLSIERAKESMGWAPSMKIHEGILGLVSGLDPLLRT